MGNRKCYLWHYANKTRPNLGSAWPEKSPRNITKHRQRYGIVKCDSFLIQFAYEMTQSPLNATLNKSPRDLWAAVALRALEKYCVNPIETTTTLRPNNCQGWALFYFRAFPPQL